MTTHKLKIEVLGTNSIAGTLLVEHRRKQFAPDFLSRGDCIKVYPAKIHKDIDYKEMKNDLLNALDAFADLEYIEIIDNTGNIV